MRLLLTNDDGWNARGLAILIEAAECMGAQWHVVAPERDRSGVSHAMTLSEPLTVRQYHSRCYALNGTPADCVTFAFSEIYGDADKPDAVLSGVNHGSNISDEMIGSGTVAGARAGAYRGVTSIALSQVFCGRSLHAIDETPISPQGVVDVVAAILQRKWPQHILFNVNFPDHPVAGVTRKHEGRRLITQLHERPSYTGKLEKRTNPRGGEYYWYSVERIAANRAAAAAGGGTDTPLSLPEMPTDQSAVDGGAVSISVLPAYPRVVTEVEGVSELNA